MYGGGVKPTRTVGLVGQSSSQLPALLRAVRRAARCHRRDPGVPRRGRRAGGPALGRRVGAAGGRAGSWSGRRRPTTSSRPSSRRRCGSVGAAAGDRRARPHRRSRRSGCCSPRTSRPEPRPRHEGARGAGRAGRDRLVLLFMAIAFYGASCWSAPSRRSPAGWSRCCSRGSGRRSCWPARSLGIGLVGLAQFTLVAGSALVALKLSGNTLAPTTTPSTIGWIVFWFILGYAFYAVLYATAGSLVSRQEEAQSIQVPVTAVLLVGTSSRSRPRSRPTAPPRSSARSSRPTAPMVMTVRMAHGWRPVVADPPVGRADGRHDLRHGAAGRTDLLGLGAPDRPPDPVARGLARPRGVTCAGRLSPGAAPASARRCRP